MMLSVLWQDVYDTVRLLRRRPLLTVGSVLVLTLGLGPATALFTLLNAVFFRPWQVPDPQTMAIIRARPAEGEVSGVLSIAEYRHLREHSRSFSGMAAWSAGRTSIDDGTGEPVPVRTAFVSADYFDALGARMTVGRSFTPTDENYRVPNPVAVVSHRFWQSRFSADPALVGRTIRIGPRSFVVVGVAPRDFVDPHRRLPTDLWIPLPARALLRGSPDVSAFDDPRREQLAHLAGRLSRGATRASAASELGELSRRFRAAGSLPTGGIEVIDTRPISGWPQGSVRKLLPIQALLVLAVIAVLLVACANVGNLLLTRALSRRREFAIRLSLGAKRTHIIRQVLMEAAVLSMAAGALGLALAVGAPRLMVMLGFGYGPEGFGRISSPNDAQASFFAPDALVFSVAILLVTVTTIGAGLLPALQATGGDITSFSAERHGATPAGARWRMGLLVAQLALTTVLVVGAGVLTRAIGQAGSLDPGFAINDVRAVSVTPEIPPSTMQTRGKAFFLGLRDALKDANLGPIAFADEPPFWDMNLVMMARRPDEPIVRQVLMRGVSRDYFAVLGIHIVNGHVPEDDTDSNELVVNESAARLIWPGVDPVGRTLLSAVSRTEFEEYRVVGVAQDVPARSMSEVEPVIYRMPQWVAVSWTMTLFVRDVAPGVGERVRASAASLEPRVSVTERPLVDYVRGSLGTAVLASRVAWAIGTLALVLAIAGAFGVFANAVEERRREISIRVALGAPRRRVIAPVLRTVIPALGWGLGAGFLLSVLGVPLLRRFLYGLDPFDPLAYATVAGILALAVAIATWIPARRAMAVDPVTILRSE